MGFTYLNRDGMWEKSSLFTLALGQKKPTRRFFFTKPDLNGAGLGCVFLTPEQVRILEQKLGLDSGQTRVCTKFTRLTRSASNIAFSSLNILKI